MCHEGKIKPFIIVMTYGMTNDAIPGRPKRTNGRPAFDFHDFETVLVDKLIPYIDANFQTIATKEGRAMAGLSMGGMETHSITLSRPEVFDAYGLFSGGAYSPEEIGDPKRAKVIFLTWRRSLYHFAQMIFR